MGIGSPRLLTRLVLRSAVVCAAAFGFAPSAYAALGVGVPVPAGGNSVSASVSTSDSTVPAATASVDVAPAAAPKTTVAAQVRPDAQPVQATVEGATVGQATVGQTTVHAPNLQAPRVAAAPAERPAATDPVRFRSQARGAVHHSAVSTHVAAPTRTAFTLSPTRGAPSPRTADTTPFRRLTTARTSLSAGPAPRKETWLPPLPASLFAGALGGGASGGVALLLFALATVLAVTGVPGMCRRLALPLCAPRPYPYLLVLERPD
jgi:hypothetical protein